MLPTDELEGLRETAYLLRSPKNAKRLLDAIVRYTSEATTVEPSELRDSLNLSESK